MMLGIREFEGDFEFERTAFPERRQARQLPRLHAAAHMARLDVTVPLRHTPTPVLPTARLPSDLARHDPIKVCPMPAS